MSPSAEGVNVCMAFLECGVPSGTELAITGVVAVIASAVIRFVPLPWGGA